MAASSSGSVASAKMRQHDSEDVLCPLQRIAVASYLAEAGIRAFHRLVPPESTDLGGIDIEDVEVNAYVISEDQVTLYQQYLLPGDDMMLVDSDSSNIGNNDDMIQMNELTHHYHVRLEKHDCNEVGAIAKQLAGMSMTEDARFARIFRSQTGFENSGPPGLFLPFLHVLLGN